VETVVAVGAQALQSGLWQPVKNNGTTTIQMDSASLMANGFPIPYERMVTRPE